MDIVSLLKKVITYLKTSQVRFALAGGLVTSVYRKERRDTADLDFLILAEDPQKKAEEIIKYFGMNPGIARKADLEGGPPWLIKKKTSPVWMVVGRDFKDKDSIGLDFLLPTIPWFDRALERAEHNAIDYGFGPIPSLTVEDIVISKLFALSKRSDRFKDLDDLQSIFESEIEIDFKYLSGRMGELFLPIPSILHKISPQALRVVSKKIRKNLAAKTRARDRH